MGMISANAFGNARRAAGVPIKSGGTSGTYQIGDLSRVKADASWIPADGTRAVYTGYMGLYNAKAVPLIPNLNGNNQPNINGGNATLVYQMAVGLGLVVGVGQDSNGYFFLAYTPDNGVTWYTGTDTTTYTQANCVAFGAGKFMIGGNNAIVQSTDGKTVSPVLTGINTIYCMIYANGQFYAGGQSGLYTSANGWAAPKALGTSIYTLAYLNGLFYAGCANGQIYTSPDFATWTLSTTMQSSVNAMTSDGGYVVAVSSSGTVLKCYDGKTWVGAANTPSSILQDTQITYYNGMYVFGGPNGIYATTDFNSYYQTLAQSSYNFQAMAVDPSIGRYYSTAWNQTLFYRGGGFLVQLPSAPGYFIKSA